MANAPKCNSCLRDAFERLAPVWITHHGAPRQEAVYLCAHPVDDEHFVYVDAHVDWDLFCLPLHYLEPRGTDAEPTD